MTKKKQICTLLLFFCLLGSGTGFADSAHSPSNQSPITVAVNDQVIHFDVNPVMDQGTVFVPVRFVADELGAQIAAWKDNSLTLTKGASTITLTIGSKTVYKDQEPFELRSAPKLVNGRTLVPLRFLSEAFGATVHYDNRRVSISTDTTEQSPAISGNSIGNLNNGGWYAADKEWIYFFNHQDSGKLYKEKQDGSERQKVSDDNYVTYLNIVKDKLYYISINNLYKSDLDGTNRVLLKDFGIGRNLVSVVGDWIYYTEGTYMFKPLYRMKTDGTSGQLLEKYQVSSIAVTDGKIYYTIDMRKLFVMNADGSGKKKLLEGDSITWVDVQKDTLFFNYNGELYSMNTDGTSLIKISDHNAQNINVHGDWLYYSNYSEYSKKLYRVNLIDHTIEKLSDEKTFNLHILGDKIFFYNPDVNRVRELTVKGDGAGKQGESAAKSNVFDAAKIKVGDMVAGMKVTRLDVHILNGEPIGTIEFSGQATVSGTYDYVKDDEFIEDGIRFQVDQAPAQYLPKMQNDERTVWFMFENKEEAIKQFGQEGSKGKATVTIDRYVINYRPTEVYNTAVLKTVD